MSAAPRRPRGYRLRRDRSTGHAQLETMVGMNPHLGRAREIVIGIDNVERQTGYDFYLRPTPAQARRIAGWLLAAAAWMADE